PVFLPLPYSDNMDLVDPATIVEAHRYTPAAKTAGAGCKAKAPRGKGKEKENATYPNQKKCSRDDGDEDDEAEVRARRGRPQGSNNYTALDVKSLLGVVHDELPLGQRGWQTVHVKFGQWAKVNHRPDRKVTSLGTKFKQLVKTTKPTGDSVCPPEVTRAHHIEQLINERTGTCDLHDTDYDTIEDDDSHSVASNQIQDECASPPIQHTAVARSTACTEAPEQQLQICSLAFPVLLTQHNHDKDRANRSLATTQLFTQSQQLHDSQAATETMHGQLFDLRTCMYDIEREHDRAELCIEMMQMSGSARRQHVQMPKRKNLHQEWYPEGGGSIRWITDKGESSASEE
ncbi:hypothetical protein DFH29DRAFT_788389, partial [Suillus ampliporus]